MLQPGSPKKIQVTCPACGHMQWEYAAVQRTNCRSCGARINCGEETARRAERKLRMKVERREIACLECQHIMAVPVEAQTWQCPSCSTYLDLQDHVISREQSAPLRTYGRVVVEPRGVAGGSRVECAAARIEGRVVGRLTARGEVELAGGARLLSDAEGSRLVVAARAQAEASGRLNFPEVRVEGRLEAREINARHIEVPAGGVLKAERLVAESVSVSPGGWLEGRLETLANKEA